MDFYTAKRQFNNYLKDYDCHNDKIRLKIVHTYGVVKESTDISARMRLSEEDTTLAKMIALLHDIGRFEQLKRFDSFLPDTMDHAAYGVKILFNNDNGENLIRDLFPNLILTISSVFPSPNTVILSWMEFPMHVLYFMQRSSGMPINWTTAV
ncbi:HD domain-containing protein [Mediterraneibacter gnavus]